MKQVSGGAVTLSFHGLDGAELDVMVRAVHELLRRAGVDTAAPIRRNEGWRVVLVPLLPSAVVEWELDLGLGDEAACRRPPTAPVRRWTLRGADFPRLLVLLRHALEDAGLLPTLADEDRVFGRLRKLGYL